MQEKAVYAESRLPWPAAIRRTLEERGLSGLYSHQALATDHIRAGHSVVVYFSPLRLLLKLF